MSRECLFYRHVPRFSIPPQVGNIDSEVIIQRHCDSLVFEFINVSNDHSSGLRRKCQHHYSRLITLFLYMVAELSALQQIINALTGLNGLPAVIVECAVTTTYTCKLI